MRSAVLGLAMLVLLIRGPSTHAGPPDTPTGALVLDDVADGLLRYQKEKDVGARVKLLQRLALTHDPRVAAAPAPKEEDDAKKLRGTWQAVTERPKEFDSPADSNIALYTFKRTKP